MILTLTFVKQFLGNHLKIGGTCSLESFIYITVGIVSKFKYSEILLPMASALLLFFPLIFQKLLSDMMVTIPWQSLTPCWFRMTTLGVSTFPLPSGMCISWLIPLLDVYCLPVTLGFSHINFCLFLFPSIFIIPLASVSAMSFLSN